MNDVGDDLPFCFEAAKVGDVPVGNEPAFDSGRLQVIYKFVVEPQPRAVFRTEPAATGDFLAGNCLVRGKLFAYGSKLGGVVEQVERFAEEVRGFITKNAKKSAIGVGYGAVRMEHRQQFAGRIEERVQRGRVCQ